MEKTPKKLSEHARLLDTLEYLGVDFCKSLLYMHVIMSLIILVFA